MKSICKRKKNVKKDSPNCDDHHVHREKFRRRSFRSVSFETRCSSRLLLSIYTRKLFQIVERHLPQVHCYSDDTHLYVSFSTNRSADADIASKSMTDCISNIRSWMTSDNLMLNDNRFNRIFNYRY